MTQEEFNKYLEWRLHEIKSVLGVKIKEYVRDGNITHNFEKGAKITGFTPTRVLDGFLLKHLISYRDMLDDIDEGREVDSNKISEKFGDIINYFIIQEAQFYYKETVGMGETSINLDI